jgi:hypothetical protein
VLSHKTLAALNVSEIIIKLKLLKKQLIIIIHSKAKTTEISLLLVKEKYIG